MKTLMMIMLLSVTSPAWGMDIPGADSAGGKLFAQKCSVCHALPSPRRLDWPHWRHMLGLMKERMGEQGVPEPTKVEWRQIASYLRNHAR